MLSNGEIDGVLFTSDLIANYFMYENQAQDKIGYTFDIIRPFSPAFFFPKHSMLTRMFNQKLGTCIESGLIVRWISDYKKDFKNNGNEGPQQLGISSILTILQITLIMYIIAFVVFFMEIFSYKDKSIKRFLDYLTY